MTDAAGRTTHLRTTGHRWGLLIAWVIVHAVGYTTGALAYRLFTDGVRSNYAYDLFTAKAYSYELWAVALGIGVGVAVIAVGQGLIVHYYASHIGALRWSISTFLGFIGGASILLSFFTARFSVTSTGSELPRDSVGLSEQFGLTCMFLGILAALGIVVGLAQGQLLSTHQLDWKIWVLANAIAVPVFLIIFSLMVPFRVIQLGFEERTNFVIGAGTGGIAAATITALALIALLSKSRPSEPIIV